MFSIFVPEGEPRWSTERQVLDRDRDISLQLKGGAGRDMGKTFVLSHGGMRVPLHTAEQVGLVDAVTGKPYFISEIVSFGTSIYLKGDRDVPNYDFSSDEEARHWRRMAAEALLIFGTNYNGFALDPAYARVLLNGDLLTRRDFGYRE
jgi:hypothetical protein